MKAETLIIGKVLKIDNTRIPGNNEETIPLMRIEVEVHSENFIYSKREYSVSDDPSLIEIRGNRAVEAQEKIRIGDTAAFKCTVKGTRDRRTGNITNHLYGEHVEFLYQEDDPTPPANDSDFGDTDPQ